MGKNYTPLCALLLSTLVGCASCGSSDPPAKDDLVPISVGTEVTELRETFGAELTNWAHAEGKWERRGSGDSGVLAQTATNSAFPVTLWKKQTFANADVSVRFKPISGSIDASGGLVFRASDAKNYYVVRANSLEDNVRLYTMLNGERQKIAGTRVTEPELGKWHTLRAVAVGDRIQAYLNGKLILEHQDTTFKEGWVGLWTKADAITEFDDVIVRGK